MNIDNMSTNVVGLVGEPFNIETTSDFDEATLTFTIDQSKLGETDFNNLLFLWYDFDNHIYRELDTIYDEDNSTVSTVTTHFSRYMVVDKIKWFEAWAVEFDYSQDQNGEHIPVYTVLAIDTSGSMSSYDSTGVNSNRGKAAAGFIDTLNDGDKAGVMRFDSYATWLCQLSDNKTALKNSLSGIYSSGGTDFSSPINAAVTALTATTVPSNAKKTIILMTDGEASYPVAAVNNAANQGVVIYTIGLAGA
jgi:hypothetical protein